jgi:hypothetical protein
MRVRSPADAAEMLGREHPTAVLVKTRHLEKIRAHLTSPVCIWWQGPAGRTMLANVPPPDAPSAPRLVPATTPPTAGEDGRSAPHC